MMENKLKLINLVSALQEQPIIDYCYIFIGLKVYGKAKLPDSITAELRQMWEEHFNLPHEEKQEERNEQTEEEKRANEYRCGIVRMLYDINSADILNYIKIIVEDIAKEDRSQSVRPNYISTINKMLCGIENKEILHCICTFVADIAEEDKGANNMEECMKVLRETLFHLMNRNNWNITELSIQCGVSTRTMCSILNREHKDIKLSTLDRIILKNQFSVLFLRKNLEKMKMRNF